MRPHDWLPALLTAFWATCTFACTVPQDLRPYSQRLAETPLAFIGTVTSVSGLRVTFAVHHAIDGAPGSSTTVEALPPSTSRASWGRGRNAQGAMTRNSLVVVQASPKSSNAQLAMRQRATSHHSLKCRLRHWAARIPSGCRRSGWSLANSWSSQNRSPAEPAPVWLSGTLNACAAP